MRGLSLILKPLSWVYGLILRIRHFLYDRGFFMAKTYDIPIIKIGNLALGGTGKTPFTIFLANLLSENYDVNVISRGYSRKTKGLHYVNKGDTAEKVGDEPLLMRQKLKSGTVIVSESRTRAINFILSKNTERPLFILDDAIQHRQLGSGFQILLTKVDNLFYQDFLLPVGNLRDLTSRARYADVIVVTHTTELTNREEIVSNIHKYSKALVVFSAVNYLTYRNYFSGDAIKEIANTNAVLVSALASNHSFKSVVAKSYSIVFEYNYRDHYSYASEDVKNWIKKAIETKAKIITTEKDAVKLNKYRNYFEENEVDLLVLPIEIYLIDESKNLFIESLNKHLDSYK